MQSVFALTPRCLNVLIHPLINLLDTFILPVNISLAPINNCNFAGALPVQDKLMLSGIAMEHELVSISFLLS